MDPISTPPFDATSFISPDDPMGDVEDDAPDGLEEATAAVLEEIRLRVEAKAAPPRTDYAAGFDDPPADAQATPAEGSAPAGGIAPAFRDSPPHRENQARRDSSSRRTQAPSSRPERSQSTDRSRNDRQGGERNHDSAAGNRSDQSGRRSIVRPQPNRRDNNRTQRSDDAADPQSSRGQTFPDGSNSKKTTSDGGDCEPEFGEGVTEDTIGEGRTRSRRRRRRRGGAATENSGASGNDSVSKLSSAPDSSSQNEPANAESADTAVPARKRRRARQNGRGRRNPAAEAGGNSGGSEIPTTD